MRVLIDECIDPRVKLVLSVTKSPQFMSKDGPLLTLAQHQFDVLVTIDGSLEFQQNLSKYRIGVIVVHVPKNQLDHYCRVEQHLRAAIEKVRPGEAVHVRKPV